MSPNVSIDSVVSDVFFVEQRSNEPSPQRNTSSHIFNSNEISHTHTAGIPSVASIESPEPQILTIHDDSNEPTKPFGFGRQLPIIQPSLNDFNLTPNPFTVLATMAVVNHTEHASDDNYNPQSPEPSEPSPISTPPMNVSTFDSWETSRTTTDDNSFHSDDEPRRINFFAVNSYPAATPKAKKEIEPGNVFSKRRGSVALCLRNLRTNDLPAQDIPAPSTKN